MNSNKKRNLIRKLVGLTASMAIASIFAPSTPSITQVAFAEETPAVTYKVKYKFIKCSKFQFLKCKTDFKFVRYKQ